jgi:hypothetical protein
MAAMRRRDFIKAIAGSAAAPPLIALAQHPTMPVVGYLDATSPLGKHAAFAAVVRNGLNDVGFVEGSNMATNIVGQKAVMIDCPRWQQSWFAIQRP